MHATAYAVMSHDWYYPWEASGMRIGRKYGVFRPQQYSHSFRRFKTILHQVRHPLDSIASLTTFANKSWRFIIKVYPVLHVVRSDTPQNTPEVTNFATIDSPERRALIHWVTWNKLIESYADWRFRVEDTPFREICEKSGFPIDQCQSNAASVPHKSSSRLHQTVSWDFLLGIDEGMAREAQAMALRYGYNLTVASVSQKQVVDAYEG